MFGTISGFRKHLNTKHTKNTDQQVDIEVDLGCAEEAVTFEVDETASAFELL